MLSKIGHHRKHHEDQLLEAAPKNQKQETCHTGHHEKDGVAGAYQPSDNVPSGLGTFIDPVQPSLNAQHPPGGRPDGHQG